MRRAVKKRSFAAPGPTAQFDQLLKSDAARYGKLIREANIKPE